MIGLVEDLRRARSRTSPGRPQHYYSIYQKMIVRGRDFTDIYDLVGVRILVEHSRLLRGTRNPCMPVGTRYPGRFQDYIACPNSRCISRRTPL